MFSKLAEKARISAPALETEEIRDVILVVDRAAEWHEISLRRSSHEDPFVGGRNFRRIVDRRISSRFRNKILPTELWKTRSPQLAPYDGRSKSSGAPSRNHCEVISAGSPEDGAAQDELVQFAASALRFR